MLPVRSRTCVSFLPVQVRMLGLSDSELEISIYPGFAYNAVGGGGWAEASDLGNGLLGLRFDPKVAGSDKENAKTVMTRSPPCFFLRRMSTFRTSTSAPHPSSGCQCRRC